MVMIIYKFFTIRKNYSTWDVSTKVQGLKSLWQITTGPVPENFSRAWLATLTSTACFLVRTGRRQSQLECCRLPGNHTGTQAFSKLNYQHTTAPTSGIRDTRKR